MLTTYQNAFPNTWRNKIRKFNHFRRSILRTLRRIADLCGPKSIQTSALVSPIKSVVSSYYCGRCVPYLQSIGMGGKSHVFTHIWIRIGKGPQGPQRPQSSVLSLNRGSNATRSCSQSPIGSDRRNCIHFTPDCQEESRSGSE